MMNSFYINELDNVIDSELIFWPEPPPLVLERSFIPYTKPTQAFQQLNSTISGKNVHKRMIELLRAIPTTAKTSSDEPPELENNRGYRHMINERLRRDKQKQMYAELHSMLPMGTRNDKNTTLQTTCMHLQELKRLREELHERNRDLEKNVIFKEAERRGTSTIRFRRQYPLSGIDSMIAALRCLKSNGLKVKRIQSDFSVAEIVALLEIQPKIDEAMAEKAVENALDEVDRNFVLPLEKGVLGNGNREITRKVCL